MIYMEEPIENKIWLIGWMTSLSKIGNPIIEIWKRAPLQSFLLTRLPAELPLQTGSVRFRTRALDRKQRLCEHGYWASVKVWWIRLHVGLHAVLSTSPHPLSAALTFHCLSSILPAPGARLLHLPCNLPVGYSYARPPYGGVVRYD